MNIDKKNTKKTIVYGVTNQNTHTHPICTYI